MRVRARLRPASEPQCTAALPGPDIARVPDTTTAYWTIGPERVLQQLPSRPEGLTADEVANRTRIYGPNRVRSRQTLSRARVFVGQLKSPLLLLLLLAAGLSGMTGAWVDTGIVLAIVAASVGIGYVRE